MNYIVEICKPNQPSEYHGPFATEEEAKEFLMANPGVSYMHRLERPDSKRHAMLECVDIKTGETVLRSLS